MSNHKVILRFLNLLVVAIMLLSTGCSKAKASEYLLDSKHPITVTVWNYYSGQTKEKFDNLVAKFNDTIGMEKGIVVDSFSQGDVQQLADAVFDAANNSIGSRPLPHIFGAYPDNAYRIDKVSSLVDVEQYFSEKELGEFRQEFLEEGRFGEGDKLKIIPVAKSTENLFLNKTYWDTFADETGTEIKDLATWEGIAHTAKKYYEWTDAKTPNIDDGKAFIGIDSPSNYMLISAIQLKEEMYTFKNGKVKFNFNKEVAHKIWENLYVPYIKGYYIKTGRFSSDDAKVGTVISYVGSTAGAGYFPKEITLSQTEVYPIEALALPYPYFKDGEKYAIQQGAGMCMTKSDPAHEYAAALFLKWFTEVNQNVEFAVSTGYFPVKVKAINEEQILSSREATNNLINSSITKSIKTTVEMLNAYKLYGNRPFDGSYDMRRFLETNIARQVENKLKIVEDSIKSGKDRTQVLEQLVSEEGFNEWYTQFMNEVAMILR